MPRVRFTVRTLMIAVAVVALLFGGYRRHVGDRWNAILTYDSPNAGKNRGVRTVCSHPYDLRWPWQLIAMKSKEAELQAKGINYMALTSGAIVMFGNPKSGAAR